MIDLLSRQDRAIPADMNARLPPSSPLMGRELAGGAECPPRSRTLPLRVPGARGLGGALGSRRLSQPSALRLCQPPAATGLGFQPWESKRTPRSLKLSPARVWPEAIILPLVGSPLVLRPGIAAVKIKQKPQVPPGWGALPRAGWQTQAPGLLGLSVSSAGTPSSSNNSRPRAKMPALYGTKGSTWDPLG